MFAENAAAGGTCVPDDLDPGTLPKPATDNKTLVSLLTSHNVASCAKERRAERELYRVDNLNADQRQIFRYVFDNPSAVVLIQAGPGTGKTFTQLTLAHAWTKEVNAVIFKHDLLHTFRNCAALSTVARFCMRVWKLSYPEWCGLERQMSGRMSAHQFLGCVVGLLRRARLPDLSAGTIVLLDEYTVIPKPVLFALLMVFKRHGIGTVISGDRNQLQNIHNSAHVGRCSSFDIASAFADRTFTLTKNERCRHARYNEFVDYVARYSSDRRLDKFGYALVAAVFHRKFMTATAITDTHLASHHRHLTNLIHMMTVNTAVKTSFYFINVAGVRDVSQVRGERLANGLYMPSVTIRYEKNKAPDKYLPYLPLVIGCRYFVRAYSETALYTLESLDEANETVSLRSDAGVVVTVGKENCNNVVFEKHRHFLLCDGDESGNAPGQLYNYPIYMANVMSIHMCQGRTIHNDVDIFLNDCTYQGLYVSVSRVTSPRNITRVIVPDIPSHMLSTVVNFPQLCSLVDDDDGCVVTIRELDACLTNNYLHYPISDPELTLNTIHALGKFFATRDADERRRIRNDMCRSVSAIVPEVLRPSVQQSSTYVTNDNVTMKLALRYKYAVCALSLVDGRDAAVWLHEFMRQDPLVTLLGVDDTTAAAAAVASSRGERFRLLRKVCGLVDYDYEHGEDTLGYVKRHARWQVKDGHERFCIDENVATGMVLETASRFQQDVYDALKGGGRGALSVVWLMDRLRRMVDDLTASTTSPSSTRAAAAAAEGKRPIHATDVSLEQLLERSRVATDWQDDATTDSTHRRRPRLFKRQKRT